MKVMITGATGFVGRRLVAALANEGAQVSVLVRHPDSSLAIPLERQHPTGHGIEPLICALMEEQPDVVVHLATTFAGEHSPDQVPLLLESNVVFGTFLLEAMRASCCKRFVSTGTTWQHAEDGSYEPVNLYAATKQAFEDICFHYCLSEGFSALHLHLGDTYGEDDTRRKLLVLLEESVNAPKPLALSPGMQRISLLHIEDACRALRSSIDLVLDFPHGTIQVRGVSGDATPTIRELVELFNTVDPTLPARVEWGGRPYRNREPLVPRSAGVRLEGHVNTISLEDGLRRFRARASQTKHHWPQEVT